MVVLRNIVAILMMRAKSVTHKKYGCNFDDASKIGYSRSA